MKTALVGYTGFVGSNLADSFHFDDLYNSKNIAESFDTHPDLLVYSGVRAEMFIANKYPEEDLKVINNAISNIQKIAPRNVVLISTIGVYASTVDGDENTCIDNIEVLPYGRNRLILEQWVSENYPHSLIIRLPALFGKNIKKNFIYDMIHVVPSMLKVPKYEELLLGTPFANCYIDNGNGFCKCVVTEQPLLNDLKRFFAAKGFTALNFTDSRSQYQFFNLSKLWNIIEKALEKGIGLLTVTSEPITAAELYHYIYGSSFVNEVNPRFPIQNLKSIHANQFGGKDGYIFEKDELLKEIKEFVLRQGK